MTTPVTPPPDESPSRIAPGKATDPSGAAPSRAPQGFDSYMQGTSTAKTPPQAGPNPMDMARGNAPASAGSPSLDSILSQAKSAQDSLGNVGNQLNTPNLKLKRSQTHLLRNKLQDANGYIRSASSKLGIESPEMQMPQGATALDRFLAYVNDGQEQMLQVQQRVKELSESKDELRPADLLYVQVKMNQAQQEIEYSSTLLSKVIDSIKTILNTQL